MARAFATDILMDQTGQVVQGATVTFYTDEAASTLVSDAYNAAAGGTLVTTAVTDASGRWSIWLTTPKSIWPKYSDTSDTAHYPGESGVLSWTPFVGAEKQAFQPPGDEVAEDLAALSLVFNVKDTAYGALGDGSNDDTAEIQAAIDACIAAGGGCVYFPEGIYKTTAKLVIANVRGVRLAGASKRASIIRPTTALGANPTLQLVDHRDITIEDLSVEGANSSTTACIHSYRSAASPTYNCRGAIIRNVRLGGDSSNNMQVGYLTSAAVGSDTNNDYHTLQDVEVSNFTVAGMSFDHYNSLHHNIIAPRITNGPVAIRNAADGGGTWNLMGGVFEAITDTIFDLLGTSPTTHPFIMTGFTTEACATVLRTAAGQVNCFMTGFGMYGATAGTDLIIWNAVRGASGGFLSIADAYIHPGSANCKFKFNEVTSDVRVSNCYVNIGEVIYNGDLYWEGNTLSPSTFTPGASATLHAGGDGSGPYKQGTFARHETSTDTTLAAAVTNDSVDRFNVTAAGKHAWGSGAAAADTTMQRAGAGKLAIAATGTADCDLYLDNANATKYTAINFFKNAVLKWLVYVPGSTDELRFYSGADKLTLSTTTMTFAEAFDVALGTATGTKFGTSATQKIGFFNATPVVQPAGTTDVLASLVTLGLRAASSNPPFNIGSGAITCGTIQATAGGGSTIRDLIVSNTATFNDAVNVAFNTGTGTKLGTATSQKLAFWNKAPIVQPTTGISAAAFVANTSGIANDTATFGGYTIGQIAAALVNVGILA